MSTNLSTLFRFCLLLALPLQLEARVAFQYDPPGNLTTQSNAVTVALPQFQQVVPQFVGVASNGLVAISVPVVGVGPLTFQWLLNTTPVSGAINDSYVIANATTASLGNYQLMAANSAGSVTSAVVNVSFLDPNGSGLPLAWEMYYFGTNGLIGFSDPDKSGATLYEDYTENINPTNAGSASAINPGSPVWINPNGGNWSVGTNWSTGSAPVPYSSPVITLAGTYTVTVDVPVTVGNLSVGGNGSSPTLYIAAGQAMTVFGNAAFNGQASLYLGNTTLTVGQQLGLTGGANTFSNGTFAGTLTWSGGSLAGNLTLASNSVFNINFGGGNGFFNGFVITNYGTVNWTNTTLFGGNNQNAQIYNYGLWNAQSDNIFVGGNDGGTSLFDNFGTFLKSGNAGTTTLDGNVVFNNTGTVTVQSGTLNIDLGSNHGGNFATINSATLNLSSYIFTNTTTFTGSGSSVAAGTTFAGTIVGTLNWDGGNLNGVMTLASNSVFNINFGGGNGFFNGFVITNYGTVNWTNTTLFGGNNQNAQIYNYGLWNAQSDNIFAGANQSGTSLFDNFGTFLKSGNAGTTTLDGNVVFNNTGTVSVHSGTLAIHGGGVNSGNGTFITANGGLLVLDNLTFANSATISSFTMVDLGGNTTINGVLTASNLQLVSGTLAGTNVLVGTLTWSGGSVAGSLTVAGNSVLNINCGGGNGFFPGLVLTNYGTVNWTNTTLFGRNNQNAQIYNYGLWNAQSDNIFVGGNDGGTSLFDNFGTFLKSGNAGTTTLDGNVVFNNTGTVTVQSGTLAIHGGGTGTGSTFATTGNGNISTYGYLYTNITTFTGTGNYVAGGTATFGGTIVGTLNWDGGNLNGVMTVASNSVFDINCGGGNGFFNGLVLTNYGMVNWTNTTLFGRNNQNAQIYNYGLWNAQSDNTFVGGNDGGTSLFDNFGTFLKSGNAGTTTLDSGVVLTNTGLVTVQSGNMNIGRGISSGGNFVTANAATLNFISTLYVFTNTTTFTGSGSSVAAGATFAGTIVGTLNWDGGALNGVMTLASNGIFSINCGGGNGFFNGLVITNYGTVNWTNTTLVGQNSQNAQIYNYGLWNAQSDNFFVGGNDGGTSLFDNFGMFLKSGNAGTTTLDGNVAFTNTGTVSVQRGTVALNGHYNLASGTLNVGLNNLTNYGAISLAGGAPLSGTVSANLNNGFIPANGNTFAILSYGSESGSFSSTLLPLGFLWTTNYGSIVYTISVAGTLPTGSISNLMATAQSNQVRLQFYGETNASYTVLATTNLAVPTSSWIPLGQPVLQSGAIFQYLDSQSPVYPQRFYIIRSP